MTTAETARGLLIDAVGEALCESCLAFACSASLAEIRNVIEDLLGSPNFQRRDRCVSCRRTVPAITYAAKCAHCSRAVRPGDDALVAGDDIFHSTCFRMLCSDKSIRISRKFDPESRRLINDARRQMRKNPSSSLD